MGSRGGHASLFTLPAVLLIKESIYNESFGVTPSSQTHHINKHNKQLSAGQSESERFDSKTFFANR